MKRILVILFLLVLFKSNTFPQIWTSMNYSCNCDLLDVYFLNEQVGYISGTNGLVLRTLDGGNTWIEIGPDLDTSFALVQFISLDTGFISGGFSTNSSLMKTYNGGQSWTDISPTKTRIGGGMFFISPDTGFMAHADHLYGNSVIARTTDGGNSWDEVYVSTGWISYFSFPDPVHGFATVNNGQILKTVDSGKSWSVTEVGTSMWGSGIYFLDKDNGFAGGRTGSTSSIFRTNNGGESWSGIESDNMIFKMFFTDATHGYALTVDETGAGRMIVTKDGGNTWFDGQVPSTRLRGVFFFENQTGFAVGDDGLILKFGSSGTPASLYPLQEKVLVFPNPAKNDLQVLTQTKKSEIRILTVSGRILENVNANDLGPVDVSGLPKGIYILQIMSENEILNGIFIKE